MVKITTKDCSGKHGVVLPKLEFGSYIPTPDVVLSPKRTVLEKAEFAASAWKNIRLLLKDVLIKDNHKILPNANIYIITIVTDDISSKPLCINSYPFEGIGDGDSLPLGPAGLDIYRSPKDKLPSFLDFRIMVMKSDKVKREIGEFISSVREDSTYKSLLKEVITLATATNPQTALIIEASDMVMGFIAKVLKMNRDDKLIYVTGSLVQADFAFDEYKAVSRSAEVLLKSGEWYQ
jgi:hypothetical protein